jgi:hypothetical protein|tara:strand:- start:1038 stop:1406 length:369 start_codon:yes stop_codon:yes gene_type:complete
MPAKKKTGLNTDNWFRMDTDRFIDVWGEANEAGLDFDQFIAALRDQFEDDTGLDSQGNRWSNKGKNVKAASVRSKCRNINEQFSKKYGMVMDIPGKAAGADYGAAVDKWKKHMRPSQSTAED